MEGRRGLGGAGVYPEIQPGEPRLHRKVPEHREPLRVIAGYTSGMTTTRSVSPLFVLVGAALLTSCSDSSEVARTQAEPAAPPSIALSPEASIATMQMPSGYRLEPVLTEPE